MLVFFVLYLIENMTAEKPAPTKIKLIDLIMTFIGPTLIGKGFILYFGLNYSSHPGEGYGTGLFISILFTLTMIAKFIWKYRNYEE